jgi:hypothetical protein
MNATLDRYQHVKVERHGDIFYVRLRKTRLEEAEIYQLAEELIALCTRDGCLKLALSLGPEPPHCLYSVFLAKLITVQRVLHEHGGSLLLCDVNRRTHTVFEATLLERQFTILPDFAAAVAHWGG